MIVSNFIKLYEEHINGLSLTHPYALSIRNQEMYELPEGWKYWINKYTNTPKFDTQVCSVERYVFVISNQTGISPFKTRHSVENASRISAEISPKVAFGTK